MNFSEVQHKKLKRELDDFSFQGVILVKVIQKMVLNQQPSVDSGISKRVRCFLRCQKEKPEATFSSCLRWNTVQRNPERYLSAAVGLDIYRFAMKCTVSCGASGNVVGRQNTHSRTHTHTHTGVQANTGRLPESAGEH